MTWTPSPETHAAAMGFVVKLTAEQRTDWEERAAIMEFDGGLSREAAEVLAARETFRQIGGAKRDDLG